MVLGIALVLDHETRITHVLLATHAGPSGFRRDNLGSASPFVRHIGSNVADKLPGDPKSRAIVTTDDLRGSEQAGGTSS